MLFKTVKHRNTEITSPSAHQNAAIFENF